MKENMLLLSTSRGIEIIDINSITRIEAISNYSKIFFVDGRSSVVARTLSWSEEKLKAIHFVRLHRSHLVNIRFVKACNNACGEIILSNNEKVPIAKRRRLFFRTQIYQYYEHDHLTSPAGTYSLSGLAM